MSIYMIDVHGKEWFDRVNGNSYCSSRTTVTYDDGEEVVVYAPFEYGYGNAFLQYAAEALENNDVLQDVEADRPLWRICGDRSIRLRERIETALKKEVVRWGTE